MDETQEIDKWLFALLSKDPVLLPLIGSRIYPDLAPIDAAFPRVIYSVLAASDTDTMDMTRNFSKFTYVLQIYGRDTGFIPLQVIAAQIDHCIHKSKITGVAQLWKAARCAPPSRNTTLENDIRTLKIMVSYTVTVQQLN